MILFLSFFLFFIPLKAIKDSGGGLLVIIIFFFLSFWYAEENLPKYHHHLNVMTIFFLVYFSLKDFGGGLSVMNLFPFYLSDVKKKKLPKYRPRLNVIWKQRLEASERGRLERIKEIEAARDAFDEEMKRATKAGRSAAERSRSYVTLSTRYGKLYYGSPELHYFEFLCVCSQFCLSLFQSSSNQIRPLC